MTQTEIIQLLRNEVFPRCAGMRAALLVGSHGRGDNNETSDIDFLLWVDAGFRMDALAGKSRSSLTDIKLIISPRGSLVIYLDGYNKIEIHVYHRLEEVDLYFLGSEIEDIGKNILFVRADVQSELETHLRTIVQNKRARAGNNDSIERQLVDKFVCDYENASAMRQRKDAYRYYFEYNLALHDVVRLWRVLHNQPEHLYLPKQFMAGLDSNELSAFALLAARMDLTRADETMRRLLDFFGALLAECKGYTSTEKQTVMAFLDAVCARDNGLYAAALKYHAPGLAPVKDATGWYHIDHCGRPAYEQRYSRTFGYYCGLAAVTDEMGRCFHINPQGERVYAENYAFCGNYQQDKCVVRNAENRYFHIDRSGKRLYDEDYAYAGDYYDGVACVKLDNGYCRHIDERGRWLHDKQFVDLGVFHKGFASAKDEAGWMHINSRGEALYDERYMLVEPFYNGYALVTRRDGKKQIINETGATVLCVG